jgi:hypothetical protein
MDAKGSKLTKIGRGMGSIPIYCNFTSVKIL